MVFKNALASKSSTEEAITCFARNGGIEGQRILRISPQGILVKVEDDKRRPVAPQGDATEKSCRRTTMF